jgi:hypothetical protein
MSASWAAESQVLRLAVEAHISPRIRGKVGRGAGRCDSLSSHHVLHVLLVACCLRECRQCAGRICWGRCRSVTRRSVQRPHDWRATGFRRLRSLHRPFFLRLQGQEMDSHLVLFPKVLRPLPATEQLLPRITRRIDQLARSSAKVEALSWNLPNRKYIHQTYVSAQKLICST